MINIRVPNEFTKPYILRHYGEGRYVDGEWVNGEIFTSTIFASVQPLTEGDYRLLPEGNSGLMGYKVWTNHELNLGEDGLIRPDEIEINGKWYKLVQIENWKENGYTSASFVEMK